ncbi:MAG: 7-cyano-7-deazaguanine synthase [Planctomycetota bacterium]|jgi:7-cyano-7-deazaguanine synthase
MNPRAVVLVSGGLDSATTLAIAASQGRQIHAISFDYGQRHYLELDAAKRICRAAGVVEHVVFSVNTAIFRGSALTNDIPVPHNRSEAQLAHGIPVTYVPARNTIFLSIALGLAESVGARDLFVGVNAVDYSGYPDCRPEYIAAFEQMANLATKAGVEGDSFRIHAPLIRMTKADIIRTGISLGVDYSLTHSCYDPAPDGAACGECDSCQIRLRGFLDAGCVDPVRYKSRQ